MRIGLFLWLRRRFLLVWTGFWLLGELAAGPAPYPLLPVIVAAGPVSGAILLALWPQGRFAALVALVALAGLRGLAPVLAPAAAGAAPLVALATGLGLLAALGGAVLLAARAADRVRLPLTWFSEADGWVPLPRLAVWQALALLPRVPHRSAAIDDVARGAGPQTLSVTLRLRGRRTATVALREIERIDGVFQEVALDADSGLCEGLALTGSLLLEPSATGTRITLTAELPRPRLGRFVRFWLDNPVETAAVQAREDLLAAAPARQGLRRVLA